MCSINCVEAQRWLMTKHISHQMFLFVGFLPFKLDRLCIQWYILWITQLLLARNLQYRIRVLGVIRLIGVIIFKGKFNKRSVTHAHISDTYQNKQYTISMSWYLRAKNLEIYKTIYIYKQLQQSSLLYHCLLVAGAGFTGHCMTRNALLQWFHILPLSAPQSAQESWRTCAPTLCEASCWQNRIIFQWHWKSRLAFKTRAQPKNAEHSLFQHVLTLLIPLNSKNLYTAQL